MFDLFPTELVVFVLSQAAEQFVVDNRQTVVNLALCSRGVHDLVAPTLYRSMCISARNGRRFSKLIMDPIGRARVCPLVQRLCLVGSGSRWDSGVNLGDIFPNLRTIMADKSGFLSLDMKPPSYPHLRYVHALRRASIVSFPGWPEGLTHLTMALSFPLRVQFVASGRVNIIEAGIPTNWIPSTLSHLAIDLLDEYNAMQGVASLRTLLQQLCTITRLQVIAFTVHDKPMFDAVLRVAQELQDRRLFGWRTVSERVEDDQADIYRNFQIERDVWSQGLCLLDLQSEDTAL